MINEYDWDGCAWKILKLLMKGDNFLIQHQIDSFNSFLDTGLRNVIEQFNPIQLNYDFVGKQKFFKFKEESKYNDKSDWIEYIELTDLYKMFKDKYSIINNNITTIDLSEHLNKSSDKEKLLYTDQLIKITRRKVP